MHNLCSQAQPSSLRKSARLHYADCLEHGLHSARAHSSPPPKHPIHKVLPLMRGANPSDYAPIFFRFGLYNTSFVVRPIAPCDHYKIKIAQALTSEASFEALVQSLADQMDKIRKLYCFQQIADHDDANPQPRAIAVILALDALTIVAAACFPECVTPRSMCQVIWRDASLMDQQLPLYILQAALDSITLFSGSSSSASSSSFENFEDDTVGSHDAHHWLDSGRSHVRITDVVSFYALQTSYPFVRNIKVLRERQLLPMDSPLDMEQSLLSGIHTIFINDGCRRKHHVVSTQFRSMPTASRLQAYGIKFVVGDGGFTGIFFDRKFKVLTLPEITVFSTTKSYLLNLVAQEAAISCYDDDPCPVTSYILLMGFLIDSEEDVRVLADAQVAHNHLGSHVELAAMWKSLSVNLPISFTEEDSRVIDAVREATRAARRWRSMAQHSKPWLLILPVIFLLALTFLQTIYTVLPYYLREQ